MRNYSFNSFSRIWANSVCLPSVFFIKSVFSKSLTSSQIFDFNLYLIGWKKLHLKACFNNYLHITDYVEIVANYHYLPNTLKNRWLIPQVLDWLTGSMLNCPLLTLLTESVIIQIYVNCLNWLGRNDFKFTPKIPNHFSIFHFFIWITW